MKFIKHCLLLFQCQFLCPVYKTMHYDTHIEKTRMVMTTTVEMVISMSSIKNHIVKTREVR